MAQNRSSAVMAQRREPPDALDYFPTPPWATRALCDWLAGQGEPLHLYKVWEPACGEGHMARPLGEAFDQVHATDVHDYRDTFAAQAEVRDFLIDWSGPAIDPDWVITNPPFRLASEFVRIALSYARRGAAMFVRTGFLESAERYRDLFSTMPPAAILQFSERVPIFKGRLDPSGSSATAYCWLVWLPQGAVHTRFDWIAPCRERLERPGDYPVSSPVPFSLPLGGVA